MQVFVCQAPRHDRIKTLRRFIAFEIFVIFKIMRADLAIVIINVFTGLLTANAESIAKMPGCQSSLPESNRLNKPVAQ